MLSAAAGQPHSVPRATEGSACSNGAERTTAAEVALAALPETAAGWAPVPRSPSGYAEYEKHLRILRADGEGADPQEEPALRRDTHDTALRLFAARSQA